MKAKGIFTHLSKSLAGNEKGISLIEVIVSMGILAIVAGPFLGTIILSTRNNSYSEQVLKASELTQTVMEEIKSNPEFLKDEAFNEADAMTADYKEYPLESLSGSDYKVEYKIVKNQGVLPASSATYEFEDLRDSSFCDLEFYVDSGSIYLEDIPYSLSNELVPIDYYLEIIETSGVYTYKFYDEGNSFLQTAQLPYVSGTNPIKIKIGYLNGCEDPLRLNVDIDDIEDREVVFYIIDDEKDLLQIYNAGSTPFYQFDEVSTDHIEYYNELFKIELIVKFRGEKINTMVSYVKKNR